MIKEDNTYIFVYGTLMKENSNQECHLSGSQFIGKAVAEGFALYVSREDYLSTESMAVIIDNMCGDSRKNDIILLNEVENKIRNIAAHTIVSVTEDSIKKDTEFTPKQILVMLRNVAGIVNINISQKVWNSYDDANSTIKRLLE